MLGHTPQSRLYKSLTSLRLHSLKATVKNVPRVSWVTLGDDCGQALLSTTAQGSMTQEDTAPPPGHTEPKRAAHDVLQAGQEDQQFCPTRASPLSNAVLSPTLYLTSAPPHPAFPQSCPWPLYLTAPYTSTELRS